MEVFLRDIRKLLQSHTTPCVFVIRMQTEGTLTMRFLLEYYRSLNTSDSDSYKRVIVICFVYLINYSLIRYC